MNTKAKRINTFTKAYHALREIDDVKALRKAKLSMLEYEIVYDIMSQLSGITDRTVITINQASANWFIKYGFTVREIDIGWEVSI